MHTLWVTAKIPNQKNGNRDTFLWLVAAIENTLGGFRALELLGDVSKLFGNYVCKVLQMFWGIFWKCFGDGFEHVSETFGNVFERVFKYFRAWDCDTPCKIFCRRASRADFP